MNDLALVGLQVRYEQKQFWRNVPSAVFAFFFPVMFLVVFSLIFRDAHVREMGNITGPQYYVPAILCFGVVGATFTNLAVTLSIRRDAGVLKRLRAMPLPPWVYMGGVIGSAIVIAVLLVAVTLLIGRAAFGVDLPRHAAGLLVAVTVGTLCFCPLGLALAALIPNGESAPAIVNAVLFPVVFISGVFFAVGSDSAVVRIARVLPLRHFVTAVFDAFYSRAGGLALDGDDLLVMLAWGAVGIAVALRRFTWVPRV